MGVVARSLPAMGEGEQASSLVVEQQEAPACEEAAGEEPRGSGRDGRRGGRGGGGLRRSRETLRE